MGFRKFIIVDNGSTDNTGKLINSFKKKTSPSTTVIRIDDPRKGHRQTSTTNGCAKLAQIIFPKALWIFPNDADEFIVLDEPLENALSKVPNTVNCIYTPRITYIPSDDFFTYQKATPFYESIHIAHKRNPYSNPDDSKYNGKTFIIAQQGLLVTKGNHVATLTTPTQPLYISAHDIGIHIREFPLRSPEHALKKIIKMGIANNDFDKAYPNAQFRHYAHEKYENYLKQGDAAGMEEFKKFMAQGGCIFDERMPLKLALRTVLQPQ